MEIPKATELEQRVFAIKNDKEFDEIALKTFNFQYFNNGVYRSYCDAICRDPGSVTDIGTIPFLPISLFKTHDVTTTEFTPRLIFESSGSTGTIASRHLIRDEVLYEKSFMACFEKFFGPVGDYCFIGLLPSYLEQGRSSLVYMVDYFIKKSGHHLSGFYLYDYRKLHETLTELEKDSQKTILFGVTYALLEFAVQFPCNLEHTIIIETGGMKGRQQEITRNELCEQLGSAFGLTAIHSEYGMTELFSQAYGVNGRYNTPAWMRILIRDETDPFSHNNRSGAIDVVDLANIYSSSFIATEDIGRLHPDGSFEVLGRMDHTDIRGCSQLVV